MRYFNAEYMSKGGSEDEGARRKNRENGRVVVAAGEDVMDRLLIEWQLQNVIHVLTAGNEGPVICKECSVTECPGVSEEKDEMDCKLDR